MQSFVAVARTVVAAALIGGPFGCSLLIADTLSGKPAEGQGGAAGAGGAPVTSTGSSPCTADGDCTTPNACVKPACDMAHGTCVFTPLPDEVPTPGATPVVGDCHVQICLGGMSASQIDDNDLPPVPARMTGCADAVCTHGVPSNPLHAAGSACSAFMGTRPGFCDTSGQCVECTLDDECPGTTDDCHHPACVDGACTMANTPSGAATTQNPPQIAGDCLTIVCDGMGGTTTIPSDADVKSSGTVCITDGCSGGVATQTLNAGATCGMAGGMPQQCSKQGLCGCQTNGDCAPPNTCGGGNPGTPLACGCTKTTCAARGVTCGTIPDGCFGMLDCSDGATDGKETDVDCGGNVATCATRCAQGKMCSAGSDCGSGFCVDGVCCNMQCNGTCEACSAAAKGQGADGVCGAVAAGKDPHAQCALQPASTCGNVGGCNGSGACAHYPNGTVCQQASCSGSTLTNARTCTNGMCAAAMPPMQDCSPAACSSGACSTSCTVDNDCASGSYCVVASHECAQKLASGQACAAADQCQSGLCVDGVCCTSACTSACMACDVSGHAGTCSPIPPNQTDDDPPGACGPAASMVCNGKGMCLAANGAACSRKQDCASGNCSSGECAP